jgi:nucleotide-binding universal stress UspA family protein
MIKGILTRVDGAHHARAAVEWVSKMSVRFNAPSLIFHVIVESTRKRKPEALRGYADVEKTHGSDAEIIELMGHQVAEVALAHARTRGASQFETMVDVGDTASRILEAGKLRDIDLIVMGRREEIFRPVHPRNPFWKRLLPN